MTAHFSLMNHGAGEQHMRTGLNGQTADACVAQPERNHA